MNTKTQNKDQTTEKNKDLTTQEPGKTGTDVVTYDFGEDAGVGMEEVSREEYKIPFLAVLDAKSPQCKPVSNGGVPGAKAGAFFNTATGEVFDGEKGLYFIPVMREENYPEFVSRDEAGNGGGFVGIRRADDPLVVKLRNEQGKFGRLKVPPQDGNAWKAGVDHELTQTFYLFGLIMQELTDVPTPVVIGFKSTQIKKYQGFMTRMQGLVYKTAKGMVAPAMWAHVWKLTSQYEQKGQFSWYGWVLRLKEEPSAKSLLKLTDDLYIAGKALHQSLKGGQTKADFAAQQTAASAADEEIPM